MKKLKAFCAALLLFIGASAASNAPGPGDELLSLLSSSSSSTALAAGEVEDAVIASFNKEFKNVKQVNWSKTAEFYFARFSINGASYNTAFAEDGAYLAISRQIPFNQVPIATSEALLKKYSSEQLPMLVTEVCLEGETDYYLKTDSRTHILLLKCSPDGRISVFKKTKKKILVGSVY